MQIGRKASSACSATAINARITGSERGTVPVPDGESCRSEPISTMARSSLMTCSFSTACNLSRVSDLKFLRTPGGAANRIHLTSRYTNREAALLDASPSQNQRAHGE